MKIASVDLTAEAAGLRRDLTDYDSMIEHNGVVALVESRRKLRPRLAKLEQLATEVRALKDDDPRALATFNDVGNLLLEIGMLKQEAAVALDEQCFQEHGTHLESMLDPKLREFILRGAALAPKD